MIDSEKHKVSFSLEGVPYIEKFVDREVEMRQLEDYFHSQVPGPPRRKVFVLYGLGGIGKTQLAIAYARKYLERYSSVFWVDGSSRDKARQSFFDIATRLPQPEVSGELKRTLEESKPDMDVVVKAVRQWFSQPSNRYWLLIFDNVDHYSPDTENPQAFDVKELFPSADHGCIIITTRLAGLGRRWDGQKVEKVNKEQAKAILERNAKRSIQGICLTGWLVGR